jgi:hypothetical protein
MTASLEHLRTEHEREFIGPELKALLERVASATARAYPPTYSEAGVWNDESIADALQGWTAERLIGRRDLTKLLTGARSLSALRAGLTKSFGQYLTNGRERSSVTNLYQRTVKMLASDQAFARIGAAPKPHEQLWSVTGDSREGPSSTNLRARLGVAAQLTDEDLQVVKYGPFSLKSSPILRKPALKRFLTHLLEGVGPLTPADIIEVMRRRFALVEPESVELDDDFEPPEPTVHDQATQQAIAQSVAGRLGGERARLLSALAEHEDFESAAEAIGTDEATVRRAYADMLAMVTADAVEPDETEHICGLILETLFENNE